MKEYYEQLYMYLFDNLFSLVQFSRSVVSDSSPPHESQHARPPSVVKYTLHESFPGGSDGEESACSAGDPVSISG